MGQVRLAEDLTVELRVRAARARTTLPALVDEILRERLGSDATVGSEHRPAFDGQSRVGGGGSDGLTSESDGPDRKPVTRATEAGAAVPGAPNPREPKLSPFEARAAKRTTRETWREDEFGNRIEEE